jgi:DoxX.
MSTTTTASPAQPASRGFVRYLPAIGRILLGLPFVIFGLNAFLDFIPPPSTPLPDGAVAFITALMETGYMFPLIGVTHLVVGVLLVTNRFVPLALVLLAPFLVHSVAFHLTLERSGLPMALVFTALTLALAWHHRRAYAPLFIARAS